ncbi:MAG: energy transducer TonB [bacterium]
MSRDILYSFMGSCAIHLTMAAAVLSLTNNARKTKPDKIYFTEVSFARIDDKKIDAIIKKIQKTKKRTSSLFTLPSKIKTKSVDGLAETHIPGRKFKNRGNKTSERTQELRNNKADISSLPFPSLKIGSDDKALLFEGQETPLAGSAMPGHIEKGGSLKNRKPESIGKEFEAKPVNRRTGDILSDIRTETTGENRTEIPVEPADISGYGLIGAAGGNEKGKAFPQALTNPPEEKPLKDTAPSFNAGKIRGGQSSRSKEKSVLDTGGSGITISGEIRNREILKSYIPEYPPWLKEEGVEPVVVLRFTVLPGGHVKDRIFVKRTSGYKKLDDLAIKEMLKWIFAPARGGNAGREETGEIIFKFSLK